MLQFTVAMHGMKYQYQIVLSKFFTFCLIISTSQQKNLQDLESMNHIVEFSLKQNYDNVKNDRERNYCIFDN